MEKSLKIGLEGLIKMFSAMLEHGGASGKSLEQGWSQPDAVWGRIADRLWQQGWILRFLKKENKIAVCIS